MKIGQNVLVMVLGVALVVFLVTWYVVQERAGGGGDRGRSPTPPAATATR